MSWVSRAGRSAGNSNWSALKIVTLRESPLARRIKGVLVAHAGLGELAKPVDPGLRKVNGHDRCPLPGGENVWLFGRNGLANVEDSELDAASRLVIRGLYRTAHWRYRFLGTNGDVEPEDGGCMDRQGVASDGGEPGVDMVGVVTDVT